MTSGPADARTHRHDDGDRTGRGYGTGGHGPDGHPPGGSGAGPDPAGFLRAHGLRATGPRLRVLAALGSCEPADHPTADALRRAVGDGIALTTVYRTLETFEHAGLVWATHTSSAVPWPLPSSVPGPRSWS